MSINIVKGVELGLGFEQTRRFGSGVHDVIEGRRDDGTWVHRTNNAGGPDRRDHQRRADRRARRGQADLDARPAAADRGPRDRRGGREGALRAVRHLASCPAAGVIGEAMVMLTLARFVLEKTGGDSMPEVLDNLHRYRRGWQPPVGAGRGRPVGRATGPRPRRPGPLGDERRGDASRGRLTAVDVVLVGLPGSGKTAVGRRLANRHGAAFIDLDDQIEARGRPDDPRDLRAGRRGRVPAPRARRGGVAGPRRTPRPACSRVISPGGGAIVDPRNRWTSTAAASPSGWTSGRRSLPQRLRRSPTVRPLIQGADPLGRDPQARRGSRARSTGRRPA